MAIVDAARGGRQFTDAELDEPGAESPARETIQHADKFGPQFRSVLPGREKDLGYDPEADAQDWMNDLASKRKPRHIGAQTIHEYYASPGSARNE